MCTLSFSLTQDKIVIIIDVIQLDVENYILVVCISSIFNFVAPSRKLHNI